MAARQHDFPGTRNNLSMSHWQITSLRLVALAKLLQKQHLSSRGDVVARLLAPPRPILRSPANIHWPSLAWNGSHFLSKMTSSIDLIQTLEILFKEVGHHCRHGGSPSSLTSPMPPGVEPCPVPSRGQPRLISTQQMYNTEPQQPNTGTDGKVPRAAICALPTPPFWN